MRNPLRSLAFWAVMLVAGLANADTQTFQAGSLIIPEQANFQTPCGSNASYGLVYRILKANQPGGYFDPATHAGRTPVTLYWAIGANKKSPNRCIPTNLNTNANAAWLSSSDNTTSTTSVWNDGCDFQISGATNQQPVVPVDYSVDPWVANATTTLGLFDVKTVPMRTPGVICVDPYRTGGTAAAGTFYYAYEVDNDDSGDPACCNTTTSTHHHHTSDNCDCGSCSTHADRNKSHGGACSTFVAGATVTLSAPTSGASIAAGAQVTVTGTGATANTGVTLYALDSSGHKTQIATATANGSGAFSFTDTPDSNNYLASAPSLSGANKTYVQIAADSCSTTTGVKYVGFKTPEAIPTYTAQQLDGAAGFNTIQYLGGAFLVDSSQAKEVIEFIEQGDGTNTSVATSAAGPVAAGTVDLLAEFTGYDGTSSRMSYAALSSARTDGSHYSIPAHYFDQCTGPLLTINGHRPGGQAPDTDHYVAMHQAVVSFTANVAKRMNVVPPKIGLVDSNSNGDSTGSNSVSGLQILDAYLGNAGLYLVNSSSHIDSGGCPAGSISGCSVNGGLPGVLYDRFDADKDLMSISGHTTGLLNQTVGGKLVYAVLWTPHWEARHNVDYPAYTGTTPTGQNGLDNIATFLNQQGTGLMGECASIGSFEGADYRNALDTPNTNFLFTNRVATNGLSTDDGRWEGRNCTDPDYPSNITHACSTISAAGNAETCNDNSRESTKKECMVWDNNFVPFAQIGDYHFVQVSGTVNDFKPDPTTTTNYKAGALRLATSWTNYADGDYPAGPSGCRATDTDCDNGWDILDLGYVDNDPKKGTVVYVAGHDYQISTAATRLILDTLLNLGSNLTQTDYSMSAPTIYSDPNGATSANNTTVTGSVPLVFAPVFDVVSGAEPTRFNYGWDNGSQWIFPQIPGNIYESTLLSQVGSASALQTGISNYNNSSVLWDARGALSSVYENSANGRNLFTYIGGKIQTVAGARNGKLQKGWVPSPVSPDELGKTANGSATYDATKCVDVMSWTAPAGVLQFTYGTGDGVCDIEEATQLIAPPTSGSAADIATWVATTATQASRNQVQGMLQVVQGSCFATSTTSDGTGNYLADPDPSACNGGPTANDAPTLGGFVHSQPAIVPPSSNIPADSRPTVAYAAAADGQLHAFYVSGGLGYAGPTGLGFPNTAASVTFATDYANQFSTATSAAGLPKPMTELWSYMPLTQLPLLAGNQQMLDSAPVVQDVFADFHNPPTGVKEWHTVLVATAGGPISYPGSEIFAIDITNPLKPVLLWDLVGAWNQTGFVTPVELANSSTPAGTKIQYVQMARTATAPTPAYPAQGARNSGIYDYSQLGATYGLTLGQTRQGQSPIFPVYLSSNFNNDTDNAPLNQGVQVYAVDIATGQKMWHWMEPYDNTGNTPSSLVTPQANTLLPDPNTGLVSTVYVPDLAGQLWELPAVGLTNLWTGMGVSDGTVNTGAIFETKASENALDVTEPLTTSIAVAKLPAAGSFGPTAALKPWAGKLIALVGTDGSPDAFVNGTGKIHVVDVDPSSRLSTGSYRGMAPGDTSPAGQLASPNPTSLAPFPLSLPTNERAYGSITITGTVAYISTADSVITNPLDISAGVKGGLYALDLSALASGDTVGSNLISQYGTSEGSFAAPAVFTDTATGITHVLVDQAGQMAHFTTSANSHSKADSSLSVNNSQKNGLPYRLLGWLKRMLR